MNRRTQIFAGLIVLLVVAACGGDAATPVPPAPTVEPPVATKAPTSPPADTPVPAVELDPEKRVEQGGFAFQPIPGYDVVVNEAEAMMIAPDANVTGPFFMLNGVPNEFAMNLDELYEIFESEFDEVDFAEAYDITVGGVPGKAADVTGAPEGEELAGRVAVLLPTPEMGFLMIGSAPAGRWEEETEPLFEAVLASVSFFEPVAVVEPTVPPVPTAAPVLDLDLDPGWYIYTNANDVRGLALHEGILYAAGLGGVVAWDLSTSTPMKQTTFDGLGHISTYDVTVCDIPETRVVVATERGLSFFDPSTGGWDTTPITPEDSGVATSDIDTLYCDAANGRLLIGSWGLGVLDLNSGDFRTFTDDDGLTWNGVRDIAVFGSDIWLASGYNGVSVISGDTVTAYNEDAGMPEESVHAIAAAADGTIWMGSMRGLIKFDGSNWTLYNRDNVEGIDSDLYEVEVAADGTVWVGSAHGGICQFDPSSETCLTTYKDTTGYYISDLLLDDEGRLIFSTDVNVQILEGDATTMLVLEEDILASNFVDSLAIDAEGMLWVGTDGGIHRFDPANPDGTWDLFKSGEGGPGGNWANDIFTQPDGSVWLAITNGRASHYDGTTWTVYEDYYSVDFIAVDAQGRIWFADEGEGIIILDGSDVTTLTEDNGLPSNYVHAVLPDGDAVWIGTAYGLVRYENDEAEVIFDQDSPDMPSDNVVTIIKEPAGTLLLGATGAVMRYDYVADKITVLLDTSETDLISWSDSISGIALGRDGELWVGTYGAGLLYSFDDGANWEKVARSDGLPSDDVTAILVDQYNTVWIGGGFTNGGGGLTRYIP
jgi:ligand-binding sensor domain-containing protein